MSQELQNAVVRSLVLEADRETVWRAISSDEGLAGWLAESATIDVRPGGRGVVRFAGGHERRAAHRRGRARALDHVRLVPALRSRRSRRVSSCGSRTLQTARRGSPSARRASRAADGRGAGRLAAAAWAWEAVLMALAALVVLVAVV